MGEWRVIEGRQEVDPVKRGHELVRIRKNDHVDATRERGCDRSAGRLQRWRRGAIGARALLRAADSANASKPLDGAHSRHLRSSGPLCPERARGPCLRTCASSRGRCRRVVPRALPIEVALRRAVFSRTSSACGCSSRCATRRRRASSTRRRKAKRLPPARAEGSLFAAAQAVLAGSAARPDAGSSHGSR